MTGTVRVSAVMGPESSYGSGATVWHRFPTGITLSINPSNNMSYLSSIGSKTFDVGVGGKFNGSGSFNCKLDYNILYPLFLICDTYSYDSASGTHKFTIEDGKRMKSFAIRFKKLNRMVGGPQDETTELTGCVATSFDVRQGSGSATLDLSVRFSFRTMETSYGNLTETDYPDYYADNPPLPIEWTCLFVGEESVAGTEASNFSITNNAGTVIGCGTRFDSNYYVGKTTVTVGTTVYSNNPKRYLALMYSGGSSDTLTAPREKALQPIPEVSLRSSETVDSDDYSLKVTFYKVYVESGGATNFSDSKLTESPSMKANNFKIEIKNTVGELTW